MNFSLEGNTGAVYEWCAFVDANDTVVRAIVNYRQQSVVVVGTCEECVDGLMSAKGFSWSADAFQSGAGLRKT